MQHLYIEFQGYRTKIRIKYDKNDRLSVIKNALHAFLKFRMESVDEISLGSRFHAIAEHEENRLLATDFSRDLGTIKEIFVTEQR